MIDPELLAILVCPDTRLPVKLAAEDVVKSLNDQITAGTLKNVGGEVVSEGFEGGLLRDDGKILYAIRDGIPVMLIDEGIPLEAAPAESA